MAGVMLHLNTAGSAVVSDDQADAEETLIRAQERELIMRPSRCCPKENARGAHDFHCAPSPSGKSLGHKFLARSTAQELLFKEHHDPLV